MFETLFFLIIIIVLIVFATRRGGVEALERQEEGYRLFKNVILKTPDGTTEIDCIAVSPYGIFVVEIKDYNGWIFGDARQKKWTQSFRKSYGWFGSYRKNTFQFQNPLHQNYKHVKAVESFLGIDSKMIFNVVVFEGDSEFQTDLPENVMKERDFIPYIKSHTIKVLSDETVAIVTRKLNDYEIRASVTVDDHVRNLAKNMEHPVCPKCGKAMVVRIARTGSRAGSEFWGCVNFPSCRVIKNVEK